jgi:hypothetical protein
MINRILENLSDLLSDLPELIFGLFDDNQEVIVICVVIMLAYWCFLQKH